MNPGTVQYAFLSQIIPYADPELEKLSGFGRALLPHLEPGRDREPIHLAGVVELECYPLHQVSTGTISLGDGEGGQVSGLSAVGTGDADDEKAPLSEIIERVNERFGTDFTEGERLFLRQVQEDARDAIQQRKDIYNAHRFNVYWRDPANPGHTIVALRSIYWGGRFAGASRTYLEWRGY